jgi:RNA polymerase sigma-B factor
MRNIMISDNVKRESLDLLREYQQTPSPRLRNQLVELNFGLVRREVHHWLHQCNESYEDLVQVGSIGLIRAVERFDITKGHAFSSFAVPYIRGEIQHYLRDRGTSIRIPRRWQELHQQASQVIRAYYAANNRLPSDSEVLDQLQISSQEWQQVKLACYNRTLISLDAPLQDDDDYCSMGQLLADPGYRSFQLAQDDRIRLQQALSSLETRTRQILEFVFLHDLTQKETADRLGISAVTVSRRVKKGLDSLKEMIDREEG